MKKKTKNTYEKRRSSYWKLCNMDTQTLFKAFDGDSLALMEIVDIYRPYINKLALRPFIDDSGKKYYVVDETVKRILETTLIAAVMKFDPFKF